MKNKTANLISLFVISVFGVVSLKLEMKLLGFEDYLFGISNVRYSFLILPVLFCIWIFCCLKEEFNLKKLGLFLGSYAIWFLISYVLNFVLLTDGEWVSCLPYYLLRLFDSRYYQVLFFGILIFCLISSYGILIAENLFMMKLFGFSISKKGKALIFLLPLVISVLTALSFIIIALVTLKPELLELIIYPLTHFYNGSVIFGFMFAEGLLFLVNEKKSAASGAV